MARKLRRTVKVTRNEPLMASQPYSQPESYRLHPAYMLLGALLIGAVLGLSCMQIYQNVQATQSICVPKSVTGQWFELDDSHAITVLDLRDPAQRQLAGEIQKALIQINNKGGTP